MVGLNSYTVLGSIVFYQELLKKEEGFSLLSFLSDLKYKTCIWYLNQKESYKLLSIAYKKRTF